jgi:hypothetical protein
MTLIELDEKAQELFNRVKKSNEITPEIIKHIEEILPLYSHFYVDYDIKPGQFITKNQAGLYMSYIKMFSVPILITNNSGIVANASGVLIRLDNNILVTNYHVFDEWRRQQLRGETLFQVGSISIPVENMILDFNSSLDLITIQITEEIFNQISQVSYKKFFVPQEWPVNEKVGTMVIASGFPGKLREDGNGFSNLYFGTIVEQITDATETKYIIPFERSTWGQVLGVKNPNDLTSLGGFSGGAVFSNINNELKLSGVIFEDGGNFFDGVRVIRSSVIKQDGTINTEWGY